MSFRTNIKLPKERNLIDYNSKLFLIGSCFSENISKKLDYFKFDVASNPFGILYNPIAIENLISNAINVNTYNEHDVFYLNERWHCLDAHSDLSCVTKEELLSNLNDILKKTHSEITKASHLFITLGTSWVYRFIETDKIVGNCHKIPQKKFLKELLSVKQIIASLENVCTLIQEVNPNTNIIFTVSPVRHLKDGFSENAVSKAHLLSAIQAIQDKRKRIHYFPSFEIMMDDLRDYRFYAKDMIHPNETAIDYIWDILLNIWISDTTLPIMKQVDSVQKGLAHKPFNENSDQHQAFIKNLQKSMLTLKKEYGIHF